MFFQLKLLKGVNSLSQHGLRPSDIQFLQEAASADYKICSIRLREGEYQYDLAKTIASFQVELCFPDVKDIIKRLYGEEKTNEVRFVRKIQTILKKMEKGKVVKILPKKNPWELQRYALSSFKFQDVNKNHVILTADQQIRQMQSRLHSILSQEEKPKARASDIRTKLFILICIIATSYTVILWDLMQPTINSIIFVIGLSIAATCSLVLGKILSQE